MFIFFVAGIISRRINDPKGTGKNFNFPIAITTLLFIIFLFVVLKI